MGEDWDVFERDCRAALLGEGPPGLVDDVDSDMEEDGPPALTDSESDASDDVVDGRTVSILQTAAEIEREFAPQKQSARIGKRKYTFKKRNPKVQKAVVRETSTQPSKAATEADKDGVRLNAVAKNAAPAFNRST